MNFPFFYRPGGSSRRISPGFDSRATHAVFSRCCTRLLFRILSLNLGSYRGLLIFVIIHCEVAKQSTGLHKMCEIDLFGWIFLLLISLQRNIYSFINNLIILHYEKIAIEVYNFILTKVYFYRKLEFSHKCELYSIRKWINSTSIEADSSV